MISVSNNFEKLSGWMDSENFLNKGPGKYAGPMKETCPPAICNTALNCGQLTPENNSRSWDGSGSLHQWNSWTRGETERATTLLPTVNMRKVCSNICLEDTGRAGTTLWNREFYQTLKWMSLHYSKNASCLIFGEYHVLFNSLAFYSLPKHLRDLHGVGVDVSKKQPDFLLFRIPYWTSIKARNSKVGSGIGPTLLPKANPIELTN